MPGGCKGQAGNTSGRALSAPQQELRWSPLTRSLHGASGASQHGTLPRFPALLLLFPAVAAVAENAQGRERALESAARFGREFTIREGKEEAMGGSPLAPGSQPSGSAGALAEPQQA